MWYIQCNCCGTCGTYSVTAVVRVVHALLLLCYMQCYCCCRVNPVTGRWEEEKSNPMEGMTDEQKEYEAEELLKIMDKLQR